VLLAALFFDSAIHALIACLHVSLAISVLSSLIEYRPKTDFFLIGF
jgi:hypothetical protein